jgi:hypothetical protein
MASESKLARYLEERKIERADAAEQIPVAVGHLSDILNGKRPCSMDLAVRISAWSGGALQPADLVAQERIPDGHLVEVRPVDPLAS